MNLVKIAKKYISNGYSVIPVNSTKSPAIREWREFQKRPMTSEECERYFSDAYGIGLVGGVNGVTIVDFDLKYDLTSTLFEDYKSKIPNNLLKKMFVQSTRNGGYHFIFRCSKVEGNMKLAMRYTTALERHETYLENFNNVETRDRASNIAFNDKSRVLIETRGDKGYACVSPTPGYEMVYGKISEIEESEYDLLMTTARSMSEIKEARQDLRQAKYDDWKLSPFNDYNDRGDVLQLLFENGWRQIGRQHGRNVRLKRPGQVHSASSALYDVDSRVFNVFSTSTSFEVNKGYSPSDVFIELECNGNVTEAFKKLIEKNYGTKE